MKYLFAILMFLSKIQGKKIPMVISLYGKESINNEVIL